MCIRIALSGDTSTHPQHMILCRDDGTQLQSVQL